MSEQAAARDVPVVVLCGGRGTRLRGEGEPVPKALVEIGGRPILWHIMKLYSHFGHGQFVLCLGYKGWEIKSFFLRYRQHLSDFTIRLSDSHEPIYHNSPGDENWDITCVETGLLTATGGRLWRVRDHLKEPMFMLTYGDGIGSIDIDRLVAFHRSHGRIGTVTAVHPTSKYGEMVVEGDQVIEFNEKPTRPEGFVSAGFFVFQREFLDYLSDDPDLVLEYEPLQKLARDGELAVCPHEGYWLGMDTYRDFLELDELWRSGNPPWRLWAD